MLIGNFDKCCTECQIYWSCETKWYRGEKHEEDICCSTCNYYTDCQKAKNKPQKKKR